jgi:hypothetical protein
MPITTDTLREIRTLVRGGFNRRDQIVSIVCEEMYAPGELDQQEIEASVDSDSPLSRRKGRTGPPLPTAQNWMRCFRH